MNAPQSITDVSIVFPSAGEIYRVLTLSAGFNSAVVVLGTTFLGLAAGTIGTFALLRKRALMGDALAHAALPGICAAFLVATAAGLEGRSLIFLLPGAAVSGVLGVLAIQFLVRHTRLREDASIGAILSVFFGAGITLLSIIQSLGTGSEGGLQHFIYGQTAALNNSDVLVTASLALVAVILSSIFFKEFGLVAFDPDFATVNGWPVSIIDLLMMALVVLVTVIGLQSVGLILIIALLIIPPVAARFWTEKFSHMTILSGFIGALSGYLGASTSSLFERLPAGSVIVLTAGAIFFISFLFAPARGVFARFVRRIALKLRVGKEHLMRGMYEILEKKHGSVGIEDPVSLEDLDLVGSRFSPIMSYVLNSLVRNRLVKVKDKSIYLTAHGLGIAAKVTRNHRLWEEYLVNYASVAPSHVDWAADSVEHVLSDDVIQTLESALEMRGILPGSQSVIKSIHKT